MLITKQKCTQDKLQHQIKNWPADGESATDAGAHTATTDAGARTATDAGARTATPDATTDTHTRP